MSYAVYCNNLSILTQHKTCIGQYIETVDFITNRSHCVLNTLQFSKQINNEQFDQIITFVKNKGNLDGATP